MKIHLSFSILIIFLFSTLNPIKSQSFFGIPNRINGLTIAGPESITLADLDGDGDFDVLVGGYDSIVWMENLNNMGSFSLPKVLDNNANSVKTAIAVDLDGDGDLDIAYGSWGNDEISWIENLDGNGNFSTVRNLIDSYASGIWRLRSADFDNDGDADIISTLRDVGAIVWYENLDGNGYFDEKKYIDNNMSNPRDAYPVDLDGDGDLDIASCDWFKGEISWYENLDGMGTVSPPKVITTLANRITKLECADFNNDGNIDIVGNTDQELFWLDNKGNGSWDKKLINENIITSDYSAVNFDGDDDLDLLTVSGYNGDITWYQNDGIGNWSEIKTLAESNGNDGYSIVSAGDIDGDDDLDIISAGWAGSDVAWYENLDGSGNMGPINVITKPDAAAPFEMELKDLNGDGDKELVVISQSDGNITVYDNQFYRDGNYSDAINVAEQIASPSSLHINDLDGDNAPDILISTLSGKLLWYKNNGENNFSQQNLISNWLDGTKHIYSADLDNDNDYDVLAVTKWDNNLAWFENNGSGGFESIYVIDILEGGDDIFTTDIDGDGDQDILIASTDADKISLIKNKGDKTFNDQIYLDQTLNGPRKVITGDLDGDGDQDVVTCCYNEIRWYENLDGMGNFSEFQWISSEVDYLGWVSDISLADADNDGDLDVFAALEDKGKLIWYQNEDDSNDFTRDYSVDIFKGLKDPQAIRNDDVDMDGRMDVISASDRDNKIQWYKNLTWPEFTQQPSDQSFCESGVAIFKANIDNATSFQWQMAPAYSNWFEDIPWINQDPVFSGIDEPELTVNIQNRDLDQVKLRCIVVYEGFEFTSDEAIISVDLLIEANAGEDQEICTDMTYLYGSWPGNGDGLWTLIEGNVEFQDPALDNQQITNVNSGTNVLKWTINNGECISEDLVEIYKYDSVFVAVENDTFMVYNLDDQVNLSLLITGDVLSYQWYKDGITLNDDERFIGTNTATLSILGFLSNESDTGNYYCIVEGKCNTVYSQNIWLEILLVNTDNLYINSLKIYPNPAQNSITIQCFEKISNFEIMDINAKSFLTGFPQTTMYTIDLSTIPSGTYLIKIQSEKEIFYRRFKVVSGQ